MTTVVDPLGTPVPIFNRGGIALLNITANGDTPTSGPIIPAMSGHMIVLITSGIDNYSVRLPTDAEIGDLIEAYLDPAGAFTQSVIWSQTGEAIGAPSGPNSLTIDRDKGAFLRKVTDSLWGVVRGN